MICCFEISRIHDSEPITITPIITETAKILNYKNALKNPVFKVIAEAASELGVEAYVIGGFVRDYLLKRGTPQDIDIVAVGSGIELAKKVASKLPGNPKSPSLKILVRPC